MTCLFLLAGGMAFAQAAPPPRPPARVMVMAPPTAAPGRSIWVLQPNNQLLLYDAREFKNLRGIPLPAGAREHPEGLILSRHGQVLYALPSEGEGLRRWWSSDPRMPQLTGGAYDKQPTTDGAFLVTTAVPEVYFSADGQRLYWFENRITRRVADGDRSREASFLAWRTDPGGESPQKLIDFSFDRCTCDTGACEETCPEARVWAPPAGISDFFFVTRWVPGQIQSDYQQTELYQEKNAALTGQRLPQAYEQILDATDHGNTFAFAVEDGGCCGWANEGGDAAAVFREGAPVFFFDERGRFHNDNYDVSFFVRNAEFAPDGSRIAYTVAATQAAGEEIRVSDSGKEKPQELERVKATLATMPLAEVAPLADLKRTLASVQGAEFIAWLDDQRLLVLKGGELQTVDAASGKMAPTGIKAEASKFVFVR